MINIIYLYLITIDADVGGGEKGINVDVGGGEERDVGGGEEKDVGGDEEEKVGNLDDEDDKDEDEWFTNFSCMRKMLVVMRRKRLVILMLKLNMKHMVIIHRSSKTPLVVMMKMRCSQSLSSI